MVNIYKYPVTLTEDDNNTLLVTFPDFPDAITFGEDEEDALFHASNALTEVIHARIADREPIPDPSPIDGHAAYLPPMVAAKIALYQAMQKHDIKKATLARQLDCNQKQIDRLLDVGHNSSIDQLSKAYAACGLRLIISTERENKTTTKPKPRRASGLPKRKKLARA